MNEKSKQKKVLGDNISGTNVNKKFINIGKG